MPFVSKEYITFIHCCENNRLFPREILAFSRVFLALLFGVRARK